MAELTEFRRNLRQCMTDADFLAELVDDGLDFWTLAPFDTPFVWWGDTGDVPDGWYICDGTNGTPDMVGYYVLGSDVVSGGTTAEVLATVTDHAAHVVTQPDDHSVSQLETNMGWPTVTTVVQSGTGVTVASSTHEHDWFQLSHGGVAVDGHSAHSLTPYVPPSITVIWIMKVAA